VTHRKLYHVKVGILKTSIAISVIIDTGMTKNRGKSMAYFNGSLCVCIRYLRTLSQESSELGRTTKYCIYTQPINYCPRKRRQYCFQHRQKLCERGI